MRIAPKFEGYIMNAIEVTNLVISVLFFLFYAYQAFYVPVVWFKGRSRRPVLKVVDHKMAVMICARNEEKVIGDLIESLHNQTYDLSKITIFVMADNCTDSTADVARSMGAVVYTRFNKEFIGKGYALAALREHIKEDFPEGFDAYFVFDADNILAPDYIEQMNRTLCEGHDVATSYRNSKNYGDSWISAGYALWFLRETRYLNHARYILKTSCAVSGTGFMFSRKVAEEIDTWPFHTLTEDIEFSVSQILSGRKIAFCPDAELFDEQPVTFRQSWNQRLRWARGGLQVFTGYGWRLTKGMMTGNSSCFDITMSFMPAFFLSAISILLNVVFGIMAAVKGENVLLALFTIAFVFGSMYMAMFFVGTITTITEWKRIHTSAARKILYNFTFPLYMFTYFPISFAAVFVNPGWKPIAHNRTVEQMNEEGQSKEAKIEAKTDAKAAKLEAKAAKQDAKDAKHEAKEAKKAAKK